MNDRRRTRRVETIAEAIAAWPGVPIPQLFNNAYDVQAADDFFSRPEATPDAIGLGPIGGSEAGQQGFLLHSVLAVGVPRPDPAGAHRDWPTVAILGMADKPYLVRKDRPQDEPKNASTRRKLRDRESLRFASMARFGPPDR